MQLLRAEKQCVDFLIFCELGYGKGVHFYAGPGVMIGRRFGILEPYISYQFTKYSGFDAQYILAGNRFHLPVFFKKHDSKSMRWFAGVEGGWLV
ncbi:MAG: hypothetical protein JSS09_07425 [Verrucomicrobia bacterium]|nr:hypothetical protein [Verrucomicrobiota bacterium]